MKISVIVEVAPEELKVNSTQTLLDSIRHISQLSESVKVYSDDSLVIDEDLLPPEPTEKISLAELNPDDSESEDDKELTDKLKMFGIQATPKKFIVANTYFPGKIDEAREGYKYYVTDVKLHNHNYPDMPEQPVLSWTGWLQEVWNKAIVEA